jgi:Cytochrome b subunit of the bc complex
MSKVYDWLDERLEITPFVDDATGKFIPPHVNIFYCLGGVTLVCFLIQFATGFAMTFYYRPTVAEAFESVNYIMTQVNFGWLLRSIHRWSASMMVLMMILHTFRVYLTGGFKKPRELTWVTGVILAVLTVSFGVTGYSLPWDQVGYWGSQDRLRCAQCHSGGGRLVGATDPGWRSGWSSYPDSLLQLAHFRATLADRSLYDHALFDDPPPRHFWAFVSKV